ncbi:MAG: hypothetical protein CME65_14590 [Halobacteriovoraceae bacterium]|nr:hypothetical protein [Halobacteriovoraceae bacterium]
MEIIRKRSDWATFVVLEPRELVSELEEIHRTRDRRIKKRLKIDDEKHLKNSYWGKEIYRKPNGLNILSTRQWIRIDMPGEVFQTKDHTPQRGIANFLRNSFGRINISRFDYCFDLAVSDETPFDFIEVVKERDVSYATATWSDGYRTNNIRGRSSPGTAWCGLNSKQFKVYDKSVENMRQTVPKKKAYYDNIFKGRKILRFELSIRSKVYFRDEEIKGLILRGKFDEAGKKLMLNFLRRHKYKVPGTNKLCPKYKKLLRLVKSL